MPANGSSRLLDGDLCVIGAGILGLAHAHEARRRGLRVVVLEGERHAVGASVANFGHVFVGALADGEDLARGLRSRERWLELGERAGLRIGTSGTLVVARAEDELAAMEAAAANPERAARLLRPHAVRRLAPIPTGELVGALHSTLDLRVDPRAAVGALAALLADDPEATIHFATPVHAVQPGIVHAEAMTVRAPLILVCPGARIGFQAPELRRGLEHLALCKLQMLRVRAPWAARCEPVLATGLSLIRYPAFAHAAAPVRERLERERPELLAAAVNLLVSQLPDGDLIVGDTHEYGQTLGPFRQERLDELVLAEAAALLGCDRLEVLERWLGVYPSAPDAGHLAVGASMPGVRVLQVVSGLGMTVSFGWAAATLDDLLQDAQAVV